MKIIIVVGARPQFVKTIVVSRVTNEHNKINVKHQIEEKIIHTK